jgi:hypothetical protein
MEGFHFQFKGGFNVGFAGKFKDTNGSLDFLLEIFVLGREGLLSTSRGTNCKLDADGTGNERVVGKVEFDFLKPCERRFEFEVLKYVMLNKQLYSHRERPDCNVGAELG